MMSRQKILISRIIISAFFFVLGLTLPVEEHVRALFYFVACAVSGYDIFLSAVSNIFRGRLLDERFLMSAATIGAFVLGEFGEGAAVMLFYQIGEWFQSFATERSRKSISALMDISPEYANIEKDGEIIKVPPEDLHPGEIFIVKAGEKIPLDGTVVHGSSLLDTSALTGESVPRECSEGTCVFSGCVNLNGVIKVRADKEYSDSTVSRILDLVENASEKKAKTERFVTRFARYYTPVIVIASVLIALLPPVLLFLFGRASGTAAVLTASDFSPWVYRALTFLVISCPCALVLSVPLSFFGGIGGSSGCGILIKGSGCLEALAKADTVVFDKTGTLTKGKLRVSGVYPSSDDKTDILMVAAHAEAYSDHPISSAIKEAYGAAISPERISGAVETAGFGVFKNSEKLVLFRRLADILYAGSRDRIRKIGTLAKMYFPSRIRLRFFIPEMIEYRRTDNRYCQDACRNTNPFLHIFHEYPPSGDRTGICFCLQIISLIIVLSMPKVSENFEKGFLRPGRLLDQCFFFFQRHTGTCVG